MRDWAFSTVCEEDQTCVSQCYMARAVRAKKNSCCVHREVQLCLFEQWDLSVCGINSYVCLSCWNKRGVGREKSNSVCSSCGKTLVCGFDSDV